MGSVRDVLHILWVWVWSLWDLLVLHAVLGLGWLLSCVLGCYCWACLLLWHVLRGGGVLFGVWWCRVLFLNGELWGWLMY